MACDVVWLKRDLRLADHGPLARAAAGGRPCVVLYVYEPSLVTAPDFGHCHLKFINESLQELDEGLKRLGGNLSVRQGEAVDVLSALHAELESTGYAGGIGRLWSHEETGTPLAAARNAAVAKWAQENGIQWAELPQTGVVRGLPTRDGWAKRWTQFMEQPLAATPTKLEFAAGVASGQLLGAEELGVQGQPKPEAMKGGESSAQQLLDSFLGGRAAGYSTNMSSPNSAWEGCSRLSPYLAWGCISLRCVYQRTKAAADALRALKGGSRKAAARSSGGGCGSSGGRGQKRRRGAAVDDCDEGDESDDEEASDELGEEQEGEVEEGQAGTAELRDSAGAAGAAGAAALQQQEQQQQGSGVGLKDLAAFTARLRWRSHFMQKLEDEGGLVTQNMCRAYDGVRDEQAPDPTLFQAWCQGATGYPLVDAVVRCLLAGGWVNFRMRAMIFSFAAYHCNLHWRFTADFMAQHFLDYEPGIHYPQAQMQAGTTGINTFRVYSPSKQVVDHDREGHFIKRYVPELAAVPPRYLPEPWKMPAAVQQQYNCIIGQHYPHPVVPPEAGRQNCRQLAAVKASLKAQEEAAQVYKKHGSRKRPNSSGGRGGGGRGRGGGAAGTAAGHASGGGRGRGKGRGRAAAAAREAAVTQEVEVIEISD